jgi:hypothetical protein
MTGILFSRIINAPSVEAGIEIFFQSVVDDERRAIRRRAATARRKRERTIYVRDQSDVKRALVVDDIKTEGIPAQFRMRVSGRLLNSGKRASFYVLTSGDIGPLNIFDRRRPRP